MASEKSKENLREKTTRFAINMIKFVESLPKNIITNVIGSQILRSSLSIGANYRAACRAKSKSDFISKMKIVEEEADETLYWLEILVRSHTIKFMEIEDLYTECDNILSMVVSSIKTAKKNHSTPATPNSTPTTPDSTLVTRNSTPVTRNSPLQNLPELIEKLRESNQEIPILVEGENDKKALENLGINGKIIVLNSGKSRVEICDRITNEHKEVIILFDWDRKGGQLTRIITKILHSYGIKVNLDFRTRFCFYCKKYTSEVENLDHIYDLIVTRLRA